MQDAVEAYVRARGVRKEWERLPIRVQEASVRCGRADWRTTSEEEEAFVQTPNGNLSTTAAARKPRWETSLRDVGAVTGRDFVVDAKVVVSAFSKKSVPRRSSPFADGATRVGPQWWSVRARREARLRRTRLRTPPPPTQKRVHALREYLLAEQQRRGPANDYRRLTQNVQ